MTFFGPVRLPVEHPCVDVVREQQVKVIGGHSHQQQQSVLHMQRCQFSHSSLQCRECPISIVGGVAQSNSLASFERCFLGLTGVLGLFLRRQSAVLVIGRLGFCFCFCFRGVAWPGLFLLGLSACLVIGRCAASELGRLVLVIWVVWTIWTISIVWTIWTIWVVWVLLVISIISIISISPRLASPRPGARAASPISGSDGLKLSQIIGR